VLKLFDFFRRRPVGFFHLNIRRNGLLVQTIDEHNLIVDGYKPTLAHLLGGDVANRSVTQFGVGDNGTAPVGGNTALTNAYVKNLDAVTYPATDRVTFAFSLASGEANGKAIMEFGLFTAGGALFARKVRSAALNKDSDLSFDGTWTIVFP
jgi:hypothetical protein